jgi:hypothetical protein
MRARLLAVGLAAAGLGCGDDEGVVIGPDAPLGGRDVATMFDDPSDFIRLDCAAGSLASLDPVAPSPVWHQDISVTNVGNFAGVQKYVRADGGGFTGLVSGREANVTLDDDDLFVRSYWVNDEGLARVRAYDACALADDGSLFGRFAACNAEDDFCYEGTFVSVRITWRPGEAEAEGVRVRSEFEGEPAWAQSITANVRVADGVAYLARFTDGLRIVDVGDPDAPVDLGHLPPANGEQGEIYNDVKIVDGPGGKRWALMASNWVGIVPVDVSDPAHPVAAEPFPPFHRTEDYINVHTLFTETNGDRTRAYLADTNMVGLQVWDVTDPAAAEHLGDYVHPDVETDYGAYLHDLYVEDGLVYLSYWSLGLVVVDATDPANIVQVGQFVDYPRRSSHSNWVTTTTGGRKIAVHGDEDFTAHMRIIDVDPASADYMKSIGELSLRAEVSIHNIMAFGDKAYVSWYQDGLRIVDLADPTTPRVTGWYNSWDGRDGVSFYEGAIGLDVDLSAGLVYLADTARGLIIVELLP